MSNTTPEQDEKATQADRIAIVALALVAMAGLFTLLIMGISTTEFTAYCTLLLTFVVSNLINHKRIVKVDSQTNGNLTKRLDNQSADILNAVAALMTEPPRSDVEFAGNVESLKSEHKPERAFDEGE